MRRTKEDIEAEGLRVESFFGTDVIVMHEGCGEFTAIMEMTHNRERYYVACFDCSPGCFVQFVEKFIVIFGNPVRSLFNHRDGTCSVRAHAN